MGSSCSIHLLDVLITVAIYFLCNTRVISLSLVASLVHPVCLFLVEIELLT